MLIYEIFGNRCGGFIGSAVIKNLIAKGDTVVGIDNLNTYYDISLKEARLKSIEHPRFRFIKLDISDRGAVAEFLKREFWSGYSAGKPHKVH